MAKKHTRTMAQAFNEWMRRFVNRPEQFSHEWETVRDYLTELHRDETPSYGALCEEYLTKLIKGE